MPESFARSLVRSIRDFLRGVGDLAHLAPTREEVEYLGREVGRLNAAGRRAAWVSRRGSALAGQTKASFDFQWEHMPAGRALPSDASFMAAVQEELPRMLRVAREWFPGKRIVDVGCGIGRYSVGMLQLGATVVSCDQSEAALRRTGELCAAFRERHHLRRIDLLDWDEAGDFDAAFCYGVVHHTGNTYLAMENVCRKVKPGGRVFFMIYAVPATLEAFREINLYEHIADDTRDLSFNDRQVRLERRFGPEKAHGWFDATSPRINDRLSREEIHDVLTEIGFGRIEHAIVARNHYIVAERVR